MGRRKIMSYILQLFRWRIHLYNKYNRIYLIHLNSFMHSESIKPVNTHVRTFCDFVRKIENFVSDKSSDFVEELVRLEKR